ncbi:MRPL3 54S ribosomal protein L3 [Candida maltosa Xu316]
MYGSIRTNATVSSSSPQSNSKNKKKILQSNRFLQTTYDSVDNYSSYKHTIFTHRLPESSAKQSPPLVALHNRLHLPESFKFSTLSQCLNLVSKTDETGGLANNYGLNILGKSLLTYYVTEYLLITYPRLPMVIHNAAVNSLMGNEALSEIGQSWGVEVDEISKLDRFLGKESEFMKYGRLRYLKESDKTDNYYKKSGIEEVVGPQHSDLSEKDLAYASVVKSVIGGLYTHSGEAAAKQFIADHILSRKIPLDQMFQFNKPITELVRLCDKLNFEDGVAIRLVAETGRLSAHPQFLAAVFVGNEKLGEGLGSSLKEAQTRAAVNALLGYYLYSPINAEGDQIKVPSDNNYKFEGIIDIGDVAI